MSKKIHNSLETTAYGYDIQGRCVSASSPSFAYRLGFDESLIPGTHLRTDGSVGQATWRHDDGTQKGYEYLYDRTGQLSAGRWYDSSPTSWIAADGNSERGLTYDRNGNLRGVVRTGPSGAVVDEIVLSYDDPANGNAVSGIVCDGVPGEVYLYDLDGNMVHDGRTGVWIEYNELNLPKKIRHDDVSEEISYIYSASGEKLAVEVGLPGGARSLTYYRGVMVYAAEGGASGYVNPEELRYMFQPEGLVTISDAGWTYKYFKTDHLGSTRAVLAATNSSGFGVANQLVREQQTDYYPFGTAHASTDFADNLDVNRYLFSGKELQATAFGSSILSLYDFGSRHYDPALGRWFNPDPALQFVSPYTYCGNNPHMYVDPNGEFALSFFIGAVIMGAINGAMAAETNDVPWHQGLLWGGLIGGVTAGLSTFAPTSFMMSTVYNATLGTATGALFAEATGGDVGKGALTGLITGAVVGFATSEEFGNLTKGQGFRDNDYVLSRFVDNGEHQKALEYFGFRGIYDPNLTSKNYDSPSYWGATSKDGVIHYGDLAFEDYASLKGTFIKESYHSDIILNGGQWAQLPEEYRGLGMNNHLEEINGYRYALKREGLFKGHNLPLETGVKFYTTTLDLYEIPYPRIPLKHKWIYKIPRRW